MGEPGHGLAVLVADAQALFAEALGVALGAYDGLHVVDEHPECATTALDAVRRHRPDVVVYDYWMPGPDGPTAIGTLSSAVPGTKVVVTSWFHGPNQIRAALAAGALGFLPKSLAVAQVAEALRRVEMGDPLVFAEQVAGLVDDLESRWEQAVSGAARLSSLTRRELEVLRKLADGAPLAEVADQLSISVGTLKNHIHAILAKTGARTQIEAVATARRAGYLRDTRRGRLSGPAPGPTDGHDDPLGDAVPRRVRPLGPATVLVADTQRLFADALATALARHTGFVVVPVLPTRAPEAIDAVVTHRPDVVVYDLHLRDMETAAALRLLSRWAPDTRIVLLSWYHGLPRVRRALESAPDVVVPKRASVRELSKVIRRAGEVASRSHAAQVARVVELLDGRRGGDGALQRLLTLTPREVQVLQLMAKGGVIKDAADELCLSVGTVKNLNHRLMRKLGVRTHMEAQAMARDAGFLW